MKTIFALFLLVAIGMLGCKPKGPVIEPKDSPVVSSAPSSTSITSSAQLREKTKS